MPQAMLAISSLTNSTSSIGGLSMLFISAGGRKSRSETICGVSDLRVEESPNMRQAAYCAPASLDERITKRSPNVLETIRGRERQIEPTGRSTGITNQSLP